MRIHKSLSTVITLLLLALCLMSSTDAHKREPDKPGIAVFEFRNKADNQWWFHGGAQSAQDAFIAELSKSEKFAVLEREELEDLMQANNLSVSGDVDPKTAVKLGKLLGVNYLLTGTVTEYGITNKGSGSPGGGRLPGFSAGKRAFVAAMNGRLIDTSTGKVVWSGEARGQEDSTGVSVGGFGGGADDNRLFDKVMKPVIQKLVASLLKGR